MEKGLNRIIRISLLMAFFSIALVALICMFPPKVNVCGTEAPEPALCGTTNYELEMPPDMPGKAVYIANCKQCHAIDHVLVGPPLQGIMKRRDEKWVRRMIVDGEKLKDKYTLELRKKYQYTQHPHHKYLTKKELDDLILYLDSARAVPVYIP